MSEYLGDYIVATVLAMAIVATIGFLVGEAIKTNVKDTVNKWLR